MSLKAYPHRDNSWCRWLPVYIGPFGAFEFVDRHGPQWLHWLQGWRDAEGFELTFFGHGWIIDCKAEGSHADY